MQLEHTRLLRWNPAHCNWRSNACPLSLSSSSLQLEKPHPPSLNISSGEASRQTQKRAPWPSLSSPAGAACPEHAPSRACAPAALPAAPTPCCGLVRCQRQPLLLGGRRPHQPPAVCSAAQPAARVSIKASWPTACDMQLAWSLPLGKQLREPSTYLKISAIYLPEGLRLVRVALSFKHRGWKLQSGLPLKHE